MKKLKLVVALIITATMVVTLFAGCGQNANETVSTTTSTQTTAETTEAATTAEVVDPLKDKLEISIAMWGIGEALVDGQTDAVRDKIYEKLNITIKPFNVTWSDYKQKIQVWAASSQLPDLFAIDLLGTATYSDWIKQGIVHALPDDLSQYPEIKNFMDSPGFDIYKYPAGDPNAKIYSIPRLNHFDISEWSCDSGIQIRKDWMENVGITKNPENMDEFITLLKAFVEQDPDKNGKKDTVGLSCYSAEWLAWIIQGYEPGALGGKWVRDKENPGKWIPTFMTKDFLEGVRALKNLYDLGLLDKDFATLKPEDAANKVANNRVGAYAHDVTPSTLGFVGDKFEKVNTDKLYEDVVTILHPFKNYKDGQYYRKISTPAWSESYINSNCDDQKVDRILRLFDYSLSDEGFNLLSYGIEGLDWKKDGDKIILTPQKDSSGKEIPIGTTYPMTKVGFLSQWSGTHQWTCPTIHPKLQDMSKEQHEWLISNAIAPDTDLRLDYLEVPSKNKETMNLGDVIIKCVMSSDVDKTWSDLVKGYRANGYDKLIEEINAACAESGIK